MINIRKKGIAMQISNLKAVIVILAVALGCFLGGCAPMDDVSFARRVIEQLIEGRHSVRGMIDWSSLKVLHYDVGAEYKKLKNDDERLGYERDFITNFAGGFKELGAKATAFFNWNKGEQTGANLGVVTANCYDEKSVFYFYIRHDGARKKLVEILVTTKYKLPPKEPVGEKENVATPEG